MKIYNFTMDNIKSLERTEKNLIGEGYKKKMTKKLQIPGTFGLGVTIRERHLISTNSLFLKKHIVVLH